MPTEKRKKWAEGKTCAKALTEDRVLWSHESEGQDDWITECIVIVIQDWVAC